MSIEEELQLCRSGDRRAQNRIFKSLSPQMLSVCMRYTNSIADAESVMMEGFFKVFTKLDRYKERGEFSAWVRRIMVNESLQYIRKINRVETTIDLNSYNKIDNLIDDDLEESRYRDISQDQIFELILKLPTKSRTVFNLYVLDGYSHKEIAAELGFTESTSKSHLKWGRIKLRELLNEAVK